jgi:hypothetical protein
MVSPDTVPDARLVWDAGAARIVKLRWRPFGEEVDREMFQVLRLDDGKIREIADYRQLGPARKAAKRFAGQTPR